MSVTVRELAVVGGLTVLVAGAETDRSVATVRLAAGVPDGAHTDATVVVLPWRPLRRGAPLPPLLPLVGGIDPARVAAVVVVVPPDRPLTAPAEVIALVSGSGGTLLWAVGDPVELTARLQQALPAAAPARAVLGELLVGDLDLAVVAGRLADQLSVGVRVADATGRDLVRIEKPEAGAADAESVPLLVAGRRIGTLALTPPEGTELGEADQAVVAAVLPVIALALRAQLGEERTGPPVGRLLGEVLGEDLTAREAAVRRSRRSGAFPARSAVFLVVLPFGTAVSTIGLERLARAVEPAVRAADDRAVVLVHEGSLVMLTGADVDLDRLQRVMYRRVNVPLSLGAGRPVDDVRSFVGGHRQALRAAVVGRAMGSANRVTRFDDLGIARLLFQLPEHERRAFARDVLGPLAEDTADAAEGRRLLRAFRTANGNSMEAARRLFLHHNTFRQRMTRLQEAVGDVTGDAERRLSVFVALDLHRLDTDREG